MIHVPQSQTAAVTRGQTSATRVALVAELRGSVYQLHSLTGLRILAALVVYLSHIPVPQGAPEPVRTFMGAGYIGVTLFFTLSGFILTVNYRDRLQRLSARAVGKYAVARFARIYPLYLLILVAIIARLELQGSSTHGWLSHVLMLQAWAPHDSEAFAFNGPAWSVSIEFFLYACFPIVVVALVRVRSTRAVIVLGLLVLMAMLLLVVFFVVTNADDLPWNSPASAHRWLYRTPVTRLGDFVLGGLAALAYFNLRERPRTVRAGGLLAATGCAIIVGLMCLPGLLFTASSWDLAYVLPCIAVIFGLAVAPASAFSRLLSLPAFILLGEASYAFYLCHQQLLGFPGLAGFQTSILREIPVLLIILCIAIALHLFVEKPSRTWIRNQGARWL